MRHVWRHFGLLVRRLIGIAGLLMLFACATPEEIESRRVAREQQDTQTCLSYGLKPGSEAFGMCRLQLDLAREQRYYGAYPPYYHIPHFDPRYYQLRD